LQNPTLDLIRRDFSQLIRNALHSQTQTSSIGMTLPPILLAQITHRELGMVEVNAGRGVATHFPHLVIASRQVLKSVFICQTFSCFKTLSGSVSGRSADGIFAIVAVLRILTQPLTPPPKVILINHHLPLRLIILAHMPPNLHIPILTLILTLFPFIRRCHTQIIPNSIRIGNSCARNVLCAHRICYGDL